MMGKKAQMNIGKLFIFMAVIFVFVIITAMILFWVHTIQTAILPVAQGILDKDGTNTTTMGLYNGTVGQLDEGYSVMQWATIAIIITLLFSILISCALARNHPVIIIPYSLVSIVAVVFSVIISRTYGTLLNNTTLAPTLNGLMGVTWFFGYLPIIITATALVGGFLCIISMSRGSEFY